MKSINKNTRNIAAFLGAILLSLGTTALAQNYRTAIGFKAGGNPRTYSLNCKTFLSKHLAFEASFGKNSSSVSLHLPAQFSLEYCQPIGYSGFSWYAGGGTSGGYWVKGNFKNLRNSYDVSPFWGGINTFVGVEQQVPNLPFNIALDAGTCVRVYPQVHVALSANFSIRYQFANNSFNSRHQMSRKAYSHGRKCH